MEKYTQEIARHLSIQGHHVTFLTEQPPNLLNPLIHYEILPHSYGLNFQRINRFNQNCQTWIRNLNKQSQFDLILGVERTTEQTHFRAGNGSHAGYLAARKIMDPLLKRLSFPLNPLHQTLLKLEQKAFCYPGLRTLFTNSLMIKKEILSYYPISEKKISVVHNGVEWQQMEKPFSQSEQKREEIAKKIGIDPTLPILLFIGNNYRRKGLDLLLKALHSLSTKEFHLLVIGKDKELVRYQREVEKLRLDKQILFLGPQTNVLPFYQVADICLLPSLYDPFANVTVEALAMGLFVITTTRNGASEILSPETGICIPPELDPLVASLKHALEWKKTPERALRIRKNVEHLDFSNQITQLIDKMMQG